MRTLLAGAVAAASLHTASAVAATLGPMTEPEARDAIGCLAAAWSAAQFGGGTGPRCPRGLPQLGIGTKGASGVGIVVVVARGADASGRPLLGVVRADNSLAWVYAAQVQIQQAAR